MLAGLPLVGFGQSTWVGGVSQDWNNAANWSSSPANPTGNFFINTNATGVYPVLGANSAFSPVDINIGTATNSGRLDQTAGTLATGSGNWMFVGRNGTGAYNLTGGSLTAGQLNIAYTDGTAIATGAVTVANATINTTGALFVENGRNINSTCTGTLDVGAGATVNTEGDIVMAFAGDVNSTATMNIASGATVNQATTTKRWFIVSQWDLLSGTLNVNGGTLNLNANTDLRYSTGNNSGVNTVNLNSGAITLWSGNQANPTT
ncbi:MAG TPA: hypothetical protein VK327_17790, partial [Candidatus Paceibacterota bacterium]|nr:hypothetical protein [Candidatus Paceibacterota bacterium]